MFSKILIANRGEIACRIMRTAHRLGVRCVAVHSDADARALHVSMADEALRIGPAAARDSYLSIEPIIAAARQSGAQAIHPGYGFLSENAAFAEACAAAGLVFIGPPAAAIRAMGDKASSKALMAEAGVPLVPGYHGADQDATLLRREADRIGYPVLIKASAGGGGKGMRIVARGEDFAAALAGCQREAASSFGDARVLLEKYLERPRHVEMQVFADSHGNVVHLFERDCSVQRRHQKVLEEAPAPGMRNARRTPMADAAIAAARAIGYVGAGTVEFIVAHPDSGAGAFHFMEMNTRLQVEHPVTEMITGIDLVEWQLRVAAGEPLPLSQGRIAAHGHAIEARIYAEDPDRGFLPATGRITALATPAQSNHVRIDTGVRAGDEISPWYDPMIAKLVVWDSDRAAALARLRTALADFHVAGPATNIDFLWRLATSAAFSSADLDTGLIERNRDALFPAQEALPLQALVLATLAESRALERATQARTHASCDPHSPWSLSDGWRTDGNDGDRHVSHAFSAGEESVIVDVFHGNAGYVLEIGGTRHRLDGTSDEDGWTEARLDGEHFTGRVVLGRGLAVGSVDVFTGSRRVRMSLHDPLRRDMADEEAGGSLAAPMPGRVTAVLVAAGASVTRGTPLMVMEAMKMEHTISAHADGRVTAVHFKAGDQVGEGVALLSMEFAAPE
ncbi:MAG: acetyl-CoA carboxylase biotin carboxylase subunit [Betaproteobacteria bacterium]|nr:acetyl-CoA carboxylase biotin carboxylase subunit [Betaproteobacteria bacterium]